jgi:hypothetical protein
MLGFILAALVGFAACGGDSGDQGAQAVSLSLQVPSPVRAAETVALTLILKNESDAPVELGLTGREDSGFCRDFVVSTPDGADLWRFIDPDTMACESILSPRTLGPGEELTLGGEWNQTDTLGTPVAAGGYLVRGILGIRLDVSTPDERGLTLETEAKSLVILPE